MIMFLIDVNVSKGTYLMFGKFDENCFIDVVQIKVTSHWPFVLPQKVFFSVSYDLHFYCIISIASFLTFVMRIRNF